MYKDYNVLTINPSLDAKAANNTLLALVIKSHP